jgi:calcium-dependent protein kinase
MISNIDYLGNGEINYSEFLAATVHSKLLINEEHLWTVFNKFDTDNTGFISDQNLVEVMEKVGKTVTLAEVREMIKEVDFKNDGRISFEEFKAMMLPTEAQIL